MTLLQRLRYIYARIGAALLVLMPIAMWLTFRPWGLPEGVLASGGRVTVANRDDAIVFAPQPANASGVLLLPGCPVDPDAYAPLARRIAESGAPAIIVRVPLRCAAFGDLPAQLDARLAALIAEHAATRWVIAGHSRGARHAARFAAAQSARVAALVLMGTSHPRDRDLSTLPIPVMKIAATNDGVVGEAQFERRLLPATTMWVRIEGGNHAQFGFYAPYQLFDRRATISREVQQDQTLAALLTLLARTDQRTQ